MKTLPSITDAFTALVSATEAAIIADASLDWGTLPKKVYFFHGHPESIVNRLQSFTNSPAMSDKKYPMIALFRDIKETVEEQKDNLGVSFPCRIAICTITSPELREADRETRNFEPILKPIFNHLIRQISISKAFGMPTVKMMEIVKWDRYKWGTEPLDKNKLNDYVDAIEIESMKLNLKNFC